MENGVEWSGETLADALAGTPPEWTIPGHGWNVGETFQQSGLRILTWREQSTSITYRDIGAVVYTLLHIPWLIVDFEVSRLFETDSTPCTSASNARAHSPVTAMRTSSKPKNHELCRPVHQVHSWAPVERALLCRRRRASDAHAFSRRPIRGRADRPRVGRPRLRRRALDRSLLGTIASPVLARRRPPPLG